MIFINKTSSIFIFQFQLLPNFRTYWTMGKESPNGFQTSRRFDIDVFIHSEKSFTLHENCIKQITSFIWFQELDGILNIVFKFQFWKELKFLSSIPWNSKFMGRIEMVEFISVLCHSYCILPKLSKNSKKESENIKELSIQESCCCPIRTDNVETAFENVRNRCHSSDSVLIFRYVRLFTRNWDAKRKTVIFSHLSQIKLEICRVNDWLEFSSIRRYFPELVHSESNQENRESPKYSRSTLLKFWRILQKSLIYRTFSL